MRTVKFELLAGHHFCKCHYGALTKDLMLEWDHDFSGTYVPIADADALRECLRRILPLAEGLSRGKVYTSERAGEIMALFSEARELTKEG